MAKKNRKKTIRQDTPQQSILEQAHGNIFVATNMFIDRREWPVWIKKTIKATFYTIVAILLLAMLLWPILV